MYTIMIYSVSHVFTATDTCPICAKAAADFFKTIDGTAVEVYDPNGELIYSVPLEAVEG